MDHNLSCEYGRVILRPLKRDHIELLRQLRNQPQIRKWFNYSEEISKEEQINWFENYLRDPKDYMYSIFLKNEPERFIGTYADYNLDLENHTIEAGRLMLDSKNISERGLSYDVVRAAVQIVFDNLPVNTITAEIFADNERSLRCTMIGGCFEIIGREISHGREIVYLSVTRQKYLMNSND